MTTVATVDVLFTGYVGARVAGTVGLVRHGALVAVIDPGMVPSQGAILEPLAGHGVEPGAVTDVILSHHHPDHTMNVGLFPEARVHDHWAVYHRDVWTSRPAEGATLSPALRLTATPGHTPQDITTLVATAGGVVAFTHLWWNATAISDPLAWDGERLHVERARILDLAHTIVPGHGAPFTVGTDTPR